MSQLKAFLAMMKARNMEFIRDRGAFFWNLFFPFLMIIALSFLFGGGRESTIFNIGTIGIIPENFHILKMNGVEHINYSEKEIGEETALEALRKHQINMLINFSTKKYFLNNEDISNELLRMFMSSINNEDGGKNVGTILEESQVDSDAQVRYVDWIVPGIIGMSIMYSCLFGVGFVLIRYRKNGVLKRMKATPVTALNFLSAQVASRFIIVLITSIVIFLGTNIVFKYSISGSWLSLLLITSLGILSLISLGLILATRIKNEELGGGLINIVSMPMMMLSGVFFSLENSPTFIQNMSKIFPLTHLINAARVIMIDGGTLIQTLPNVLYLSISTVLMLLLSSLLFKWE